jgi:hypothetical protein
MKIAVPILASLLAGWFALARSPAPVPVESSLSPTDAVFAFALGHDQLTRRNGVAEFGRNEFGPSRLERPDQASKPGPRLA